MIIKKPKTKKNKKKTTLTNKKIVTTCQNYKKTSFRYS